MGVVVRTVRQAEIERAAEWWTFFPRPIMRSSIYFGGGYCLASYAWPKLSIVLGCKILKLSPVSDAMVLYCMLLTTEYLRLNRKKVSLPAFFRFYTHPCPACFYFRRKGWQNARAYTGVLQGMSASGNSNSLILILRTACRKL